MNHSKSYENHDNRMYVFSIGLCLVALVISAWFFFALIPVSLASLLLVGSQVGVYTAIALFAWLCRKQAVASVVVTWVALVAIGLSAIVLYFLLVSVSEPSAFPLLLFLPVLIFGQIFLGLLGCYFAYATVEDQTWKNQYEKVSQSQLFVFPIGLCLFALITSSWLVIATVPIKPALSFMVIGSQFGVYAPIVFFAWLCRNFFVASVIVTLMTLMAIIWGAVMLYFVFALISKPHVGAGIFLVMPFFGQVVAGIFGCYVTYAITGYEAGDINGTRSNIGKIDS